jgi:hypothetical protein
VIAEVKPTPSSSPRAGSTAAPCSKLLKGSCPGCAANEKTGLVQGPPCCKEHATPAAPTARRVRDPRQCARFDNLLARLVGLVLGTSRAGCIDRIREAGPEQFAREMADARRQSLPRG